MNHLRRGIIPPPSGMIPSLPTARHNAALCSAPFAANAVIARLYHKEIAYYDIMPAFFGCRQTRRSFPLSRGGPQPVPEILSLGKGELAPVWEGTCSSRR